MLYNFALPYIVVNLLASFYISSYNTYNSIVNSTVYLIDETNDVYIKKIYNTYENSGWEFPMTCTVIYLLIVLNGKYIMQNRDPKNIDKIMLWYNVYQCVVNGITVYVMVDNILNKNVELIGNLSTNMKLSYWVWLHYTNKYIELLDTMFMIVRKKFNQVTFLHCYHHVLLIWAWFLVIRVNPGGDSYFGAMINSFIHVIMYTYYSMPIIGIKVPLFIKKTITNCQKIQFCLCLSHSFYVIYDRKLPIILPLTQAFVMINMLVLFTQFSRKTYGKIENKNN